MRRDEQHYSIEQEFIAKFKNKTFSFSNAQFYPHDMEQLMNTISSFDRTNNHDEFTVKSTRKTHGHLFGGSVFLPTNLVNNLYGSVQANSGLNYIENILRACFTEAKENNQDTYSKILHFSLYNGINHFTHLKFTIQKKSSQYHIEIQNLDPLLMPPKPETSNTLSCISEAAQKVFGPEANISKPKQIYLGVQTDNHLCGVYTLLSIAKAAKDAGFKNPFGFTDEDINGNASEERAKHLAYHLVKKLIQIRLEELEKEKTSAENSEKLFSVFLKTHEDKLGINREPLSENYQHLSCEDLLEIEPLDSQIKDNLVKISNSLGKNTTLSELHTLTTNIKNELIELQKFLASLPDSFIDNDREELKNQHDRAERSIDLATKILMGNFTDEDLLEAEKLRDELMQDMLNSISEDELMQDILNSFSEDELSSSHDQAVTHSLIQMKMIKKAINETLEHEKWAEDWKKRDELSDRNPDYKRQMLTDDETRDRSTYTEQEADRRKKLSFLFQYGNIEAEGKTAKRLQPFTDCRSIQHHERGKIMDEESQERKKIHSFWRQCIRPTIESHKLQTTNKDNLDSDKQNISQFFLVQNLSEEEMLAYQFLFGNSVSNELAIKTPISFSEAKNIIREYMSSSPKMNGIQKF